MNITGGILRGRKIKSPSGLEIRPTSEKMRQAFFSIVQNYINGALFVDLCSGTGIMGFEAVSRGCNRAVLVDNSFTAIKLMKNNILKLGIEDNIDVINSNVISYLKSIRNFTSGNVIFYFDPPYKEKKLYKVVLTLLAGFKFEQDVIIAVEHLNEFKLPEIDTLNLWKTKKYGDKSLTLFATF